MESMVLLLVERRLLHDPEKLFLVDFSIAVSISFVNHFLGQLVGKGRLCTSCRARAGRLRGRIEQYRMKGSQDLQGTVA